MALYFGLIALSCAYGEGSIGGAVLIPAVLITIAASMGVWEKFSDRTSASGAIAFFVMLFAIGVGLAGVVSSDLGHALTLWPALAGLVSLIVWRLGITTSLSRNSHLSQSTDAPEDEAPKVAVPKEE